MEGPEITVAIEDVEDSRPTACWSVVEGDWHGVLPADVAALLAPPVVVSAQTFGAVAAPAAGRDPERAPANGRTLAYVAGEPSPRFLTPAPPLPRRNRGAHSG